MRQKTIFAKYYKYFHFVYTCKSGKIFPIMDYEKKRKHCESNFYQEACRNIFHLASSDAADHERTISAISSGVSLQPRRTQAFIRPNIP